jgi:hypothetical protein
LAFEQVWLSQEAPLFFWQVPPPQRPESPHLPAATALQAELQQTPSTQNPLTQSPEPPQGWPLGFLQSALPPSCQAPVGPQICATVLDGPPHWVLPGSHTPVQAPFTHALPAQRVPAFQTPFMPQVTRVLASEHILSCGAH